MIKTFSKIDVGDYLRQGSQPAIVIPREPTHEWVVGSAPLQEPAGGYRKGEELWRRVHYGPFLRIPLFSYRVPAPDSSQVIFFFGALAFEAGQSLARMGHKIVRLHMVFGGDEDMEALYENEALVGFRFWAGLAVEVE